MLATNLFYNEAVSTISDNGTGIINGAIGSELNDGFNWFRDIITDFQDKAVRFGVKFVLSLIIFWFGSRLISFIRKILRKSLDKAGVEEGIKQFLDSFIKVGMYIILIALIASYFGIQTTSLVALLGSAGVTLALALQGSLSNFTGGVLILLIRPFKVGDYIIEDFHGNEGTVTEIQLFYTKLRTVDDTTVILPNGNLANTSLTNFNLTPNRRICSKVGISYDSDIDKAKDIIKNIIGNLDELAKDKTVDVYVDEIAESSINIGYRLYVKNEDYWNVKWKLNESIKKSFDEKGIEMAYNQLDVHMK